MMLKEKSSPWARLKYLYVLPVAAIAVTAFARPEVSDKVEKISSVKVNDLAAIVETKVAESAGDTTKPADVKYVPAEVRKRLKGTLVFEVAEEMPEFPGGGMSASWIISRRICVIRHLPKRTVRRDGSLSSLWWMKMEASRTPRCSVLWIRIWMPRRCD